MSSSYHCSHASGPHGHALPGDRPQWPPDRVVDVQHTRLDLYLDVSAARLKGTATHTVAPLRPGVRVVELDAVEMDISGVSVDGEAARFDYDGRRLAIHVPGERAEGASFEISVAYSCQPRRGLYFIRPDEGYPAKPEHVWTQGQDEDSRHYFPCFDHPNEKQTSETIIDVPADWTTLSNGRLAGVGEREGRRVFHWKQDKPHSAYLITVAAGPFVELQDESAGVPLSYYVEPGDEERARLTFANTPDMVELFAGIVGPYPWDKYAQIVVRDFIFGGMENTSATTLTDLCLVDQRASLDFHSDGLISHELAHMWFGDLVTCRDWSHGWLNESFATFMELVYTEHKRGRDEYLWELRENAELYIKEDYRRPIVSNVWNEPLDIFDRHLYEKGSVVLNMLCEDLGDEMFWRMVRHYVEKNSYGSVVTADLEKAIEEATGRNFEAFFDQWVYRPGHPEFKVSWSWENKRSTACVSVEQTQKTDDGAAIFRCPVVIDFAWEGGSQQFRLELSEQRHTFYFALPVRPKMCRFDPDMRLLRSLDFAKPVEELKYQARNDDDPLGRADACQQLGKQASPDAVEMLAQVVREDAFWGVQATAAKALGEAKSSKARDALLGLLRVEHPKVRRAVVEALGNFKEDGVAQALLPLAQSDASWFVEAEAAKSVGRTRSALALDALQDAMRQPSFREVKRVHALQGLAELRDERGIDLALEAAAYGAAQPARGQAVTTAAKLAEYHSERKADVLDRLVDLLDDPQLGVRIAAAGGLETLKDARAIEALDRMAARELDGRALRRARQAATKLRKGTDPGDELKKLRDDFDSLLEDNRKLRDRLELLEHRLDNGQPKPAKEKKRKR
jgi:aminopeptidase N